MAWRVAGRLRERVESWPTVDDRWVRVRRYETPWEVLPDEVKQSPS